MADKREFLMPDYYERFTCKVGNCRTNCCSGWSVTISMQDYFNLLSVPCSPELRRRLDTSLHLVQGADPQRYAQILPNWQGNCPLQREDGLCALQCECGEGLISSTCRYYPRGVRTAFADECVMSGSCEGVLETMFESREPIRMVKRPMSFDLELPPRADGGRDADAARHIQQAWMDILQDRTYPLAERIERLACAAHALHRCEEEDPLDQMNAALAGFVPEKPGEALDWFAPQMTILRLMAAHSEGVRPYVTEALSAFGLAPQEEQDESLAAAHARYEAAAAHFAAVLPDWEIYFEHMLVNHLLYQGYPYSARHESVWDECLALIALYAALRGLAIGYMAQRDVRSDFVDVCAAAFKLFDHSAFDHNAMVFLHGENLADEAAVRRLSLC